MQQQFGWPHIAVIGLGVLIFVLLFFADRTALENKEAANVGQANSSAQAEGGPQQDGSPGGESGKTPPMQGQGNRADPEAPLNLAEAELPDQEAQRAQALQQQIEAAGDSAARQELARQLAELYANRGYFARAGQTLTAHANTPAPPALLQQMGRYYTQATKQQQAQDDKELRRRLNARAIRAYERYLEQRPEDLEAQIELGLRKVRTRQPMQGILQLRELAKQHPDNYRLQFQLGVFSLRTKQLDKARQRFEEAIRIQPQSAEAHYYLGRVYQQSGQRDQARKQLLRARELAQDPDLERSIRQSLENAGG
jgi:tetratricopeptide (TPR) repeat protein